MASRDRESQFPATSIGRTSGSRLQQTASTVIPETHPLGLSEAAAATTLTHPKYRPYTPRQRTVAPTVSTTGTIVYPPSPGHHNPAGGSGGSDATTKLQLTNAKAVAQNVGLDTTAGVGRSSVGWAILEKVVAESEAGELWAEIWSAIVSGGGKATLLLPAEQISSYDKLTPEFLKDHIALYDDSTRKDVPAPVITLSGLRGILHRDHVTFYSTVHPSSKLFHDLLDPQTRSSALRKLPPLPHTRTPSSSPSSPSSSYPSISVKSGSTTLPLPPRASTTTKPPLPPRPGSLRSSTAPTTSSNVSTPLPVPSSSSSSRIPNPFASFFGNRPSTPTPPTTTLTTPAPLPPPPPPPAAAPAVVVSTDSPSSNSIRSLDSSNAIPSDSHTIIEVSAMIIEKRIIRKDIGKQMNKAVKSDIREAFLLMGRGDNSRQLLLPAWVIERIVDICEEAWFPFVRAPKVMSKTATSAGTTTTQRRSGAAAVESGGGKDKEKEWVVNLTEETPDEIAEWLQEFYTLLEQDLRIELGKHGQQQQHSDSASNTHTPEKDGEEKNNGDGDNGSVAVEVRIYEIMEIVERVICSAFYDRLFMQPSTDDASHDEALANRVAALNMLDLTLEHLDIQVGGGRTEVDRVVKACGAKLCELDTTHAPKDKARILVDAHQLVVDGLSRLPPIRLMSPEESKALREQQSQKTTREGVDPQRPQASPAVFVTATNTEPTSVSTTETDSPQKQQQQQQQQVELSPLSLAETAPLPSSPQLPTHSDLPPQPPTTTTPTPVSSDVLLPMIIFSVAKANPPRLVSNLRYTQRFRNSSTHAQAQGGGEEAFCLINVLAVAEFLENVDLEGLGLSTSAISPTDLTPIIPRTTPSTPTTAPTTPTIIKRQQLTPKSSGGMPLLAGIDTFPGALRGKVEQQVDAIAGSANKVISGVVDSSFGILRSLLPNNNAQQQQREGMMIAAGPGVSQDVAPPLGGGSTNIGTATTTTIKPGGLGQIMRREAGFSTLASIAASLPITRGNSSGVGAGKGGGLLEDEAGQQLVTVSSRPGSIKSTGKASSLRGVVADSGDDDDESGSEDESEDESDENDGYDDEDNEEEGEEDDDEGEGESPSEEEGESQEEEEERRGGGVDIPGISVAKEGTVPSSTTSFTADARSIRSFESMLSESKKRDRERKQRQKKKIKANAKAASAGKNPGEKKNKPLSVMRTLSEPRKSLSDRLATMSALAGGLKGSPPDSRRSSLLQPLIAAAPSPSLSPSRPPSPLLVARVPSPSPSPFPQLPPPRGNRLPVPNQRFMECNVEELRISEVAELLREYRGLVEAVKNSGGF